MLVFATLIYFGFRHRFDPAAHKRLRLIATITTITLLDAAFVRWPVPVTWWNLRTAELCGYALLLVLVPYHLWITKTIHRATLWGGVFLVALQQVRRPIGNTAAFQSFATWVQIHVRALH
jgi:hypothetical protein